MTVPVRNETDHPTAEVRAIVRRTLRDLDIGDNVAVRVCYRRGRTGHVTGRYREWWFPSDGEDRAQIRVSLPQPGVPMDPFEPYERADAPPTFDLHTWQEALIAIVAHEGMHHRQTPRNGFRSSREVRGGRRRYRESECDWAAYRAVMRHRATAVDPQPHDTTLEPHADGSATLHIRPKEPR